MNDVNMNDVRNPMRRYGSYSTALSAAAVWSFARPGMRLVTRTAMTGCISQHQSEAVLKRPD
jgi:hypothetical protein